MDHKDSRYPINFTLLLAGRKLDFCSRLDMSLKELEIFKNLDDIIGNREPIEYARALLFQSILDRCEVICNDATQLYDPNDVASVDIALEVCQRSILDFIEMITYYTCIFPSFIEYIKLVLFKQDSSNRMEQLNILINLRMFKHLTEFLLEVKSVMIFHDEIDNSFIHEFIDFVKENNFGLVQYADMMYDHFSTFVKWHNGRYDYSEF